MKKKVLIIDVLSSLRVEKGFICPLPAMAQTSGIMEEMGIPFDVNPKISKCMMHEKGACSGNIRVMLND